MARKSLAALRDEMRAVARGDRKPAPRPAASVLKALTEETLELLNAIATRPTTVSGLALHLGRAQSNVSRTLQRLAGLGLVRLVREGREVRPELVSTEIKVNLVTRTVQAVARGEFIVRRAGKSSSADVHAALFGDEAYASRERTEVKAGVRKYIRRRHARG